MSLCAALWVLPVKGLEMHRKLMFGVVEAMVLTWQLISDLDLVRRQIDQ